MSREHLRLPMHGRDHLPGGSDPIPLDTATYSPNSAEEHFQVSAVSVGAVTSLDLTWSRYSGSILVDLTTATRPKASANGVYAVGAALTIDLPATEPVGGGLDIMLEAIQATLAWPPGVPLPGLATVSNPADSFNVIQANVSIPAALMVGNVDTFRLNVFNRNTYAVTVTAGISVVRIIEL